MSTEPAFGALNYAVLCIYLAALLSIGLRLAGKPRTREEYFLAGRRMPWIIVAFSMYASTTSAITYMGVPGTVYRENTSLVIGAVMSPVVAPFLVLFFYRFYRRLNVTTSYEYINRRYGAAARYAVSSLAVLGRLGWLGTVIYAPALALSVVTGINLNLAIILMGVLATTYTAAGGLTAVLWTDAFQFMVMVGGALWVLITLLAQVPGGVLGIIGIAGQTDHLRLADWQLNFFEMSAPLVLISFFVSLMHDYGTDQMMVQRILATKTYRGMIKSVFLNSLFDFSMMILLSFIGLGLYAYYQTHTDPLILGMHRNEILPYYMIRALPQGISGLAITGIFAAAMSSMDAGINALATVIVNDLVKPLSPTVRSERSDVRLGRRLSVVLGTFATGISFIVSRIEDLLRACVSVISLFGGPILALFLLGILSRRAHFRGWLVGAAITIPATLWLQNYTAVHWTCYFPFAFGATFVLSSLASLAVPGPKADGALTLWGFKAAGGLAGHSDRR